MRQREWIFGLDFVLLSRFSLATLQLHFSSIQGLTGYSLQPLHRRSGKKSGKDKMENRTIIGANRRRV